MVKSAVAYIVSPAVSAEHPYGRLAEHILIIYYELSVLIGGCKSLAGCGKGIAGFSCLGSIVHHIQPYLCRSAYNISKSLGC